MKIMSSFTQRNGPSKLIFAKGTQASFLEYNANFYVHCKIQKWF